MSAHQSHRNVMISSTIRDLPEYREKAKDAVWRANLFPRMMEADSSLPTDPVSYSLELVEQSSVYIGIFAYRYGYVPKGEKISITEMELRAAEKKSIPVLIFIIKEDYKVSVDQATIKDFFETSPKRIKQLKVLKEDLKSRYVVSFFTHPADLEVKIFESLTKLKLDEDFGGDTVLEAKVLNRLGKLPKPPIAYIAHPYILTRRFFGRISELAVLDAWAKSTNTTLIFEAIGGMGKSALTWHWMNEHAEKQISNIAGTIWWSFYESDSSLSNFATYALAYVTQESIIDCDKIPLPKRQRLLADALRQKPYLLVLDGLERVLLAYDTVRASLKSDDEVEHQRRTTNDTHLRSCTNPQDGDFLRILAASSPSKILISTRLLPYDLQDRQQNFLTGIAYHSLRGIDPPSEALELLRFLGVRGDSNAILRLTGQFDNHALILHVLAGCIVNYRPNPGNFEEWYADEGKSLRLNDLNISKRHTGILEVALRGLDEKKDSLLSSIATFRYPVSYRTLHALNPYIPPEPAEPIEPTFHRLPYPIFLLQEQLKLVKSEQHRNQIKAMIAKEEKKEGERYAAMLQRFMDAQLEREKWKEDVKIAPSHLNTALVNLEDRGLIQWDRHTNRYDMHPVVKAYISERLNPTHKGRILKQIHDYLSKQKAEDPSKVETVNDLERPLEMFYALVGDGQLDRAATLYKDSLAVVVMNQLNTPADIVEFLNPFFPQGFSSSPKLKAPRDQSYFSSYASIALSHLGRFNEALEAQAFALKIDLNANDVFNLHTDLHNYGAIIANLNKLYVKQYCYKLALRLARASQDEKLIAASIFRQLEDSVQRGDWITAERAWKEYQSESLKDHVQRVYIDSWVAREYAILTIQRRKPALNYLSHAANQAEKARDFYGKGIILRWFGEDALNDDNLISAELHFNQALISLRKLRAPTTEICLRLGQIAALQDKTQEAYDWLERAGFIPEQSSIDAAEAYYTLGDLENARVYLFSAYKWSWADGPPYIRWWYLQRTKKLLSLLGLDESSVQRDLGCESLDVSKIDEIPNQNDILEFIENLERYRNR